MTWIGAGGGRRRPDRPGRRALACGALGSALVLAGAGAAPAALAAPATGHRAATSTQATSTQATATTATTTDRAALTRAYLTARRLPRDAVAGIRPGSLRVATDRATGQQWAVAAFTPARAIGAREATAFQDGAGTGVFTRARGGAWRLAQVAAEPFACSRALPAAVRGAWHLAQPADCRQSPARARRAAQRARASRAAATGTGLGQQIANVALGQVGVSDTPVVTNFDGVDCDPYSTLVGPPTPNSDGCGPDSGFHVVDENEEWCSDFAKWTWEQAGVTADVNTLNAGADSFYAWGLQQGENMPVDSTSPAVGDAVVFYEPGAITATTYADHVGIVTAVHPDGTIDMANGDFAGGPDISVQYNTDIDLATWAGQVWGTGEQWVFVTPPTATQQAAPQVHITAAGDAVAGTAVGFLGTAHEPGGSIASYLWTFGDGVTATGAAASHVFANAGLWTVALTATSNDGTATTTTATVDVVNGSSDVASTPNDSVWYTTDPLDQEVFTTTGPGALAEESWDGASWLDESIPGQPAAGTPLATLNYPGADDVAVPQVFFRAADGTLAQTSGGDGDWTTSELAGQPGASSGIAATTVPSATAPRGAAPAVFYFTAAGQLTESSPGASGTWVTQTLPGPAASQPQLTVTSVPGLSQAAPLIIYPSSATALTVVSAIGGSWRDTTISLPAGIAPGSPLSALATGPEGALPAVFFTDSHGQPAEATSVLGYTRWSVRELPGPAAAAAPHAGLTAVSYQGASGSTSPEVFYLAASGQPVLDTSSGGQWATSTLPGTATGITGAAAYPAAGGAQQLFLTTQGGTLSEDSAPAAGGAWTAATLPASPATFADRVLLYAASPADEQNALAAAAAAGLPASQVTGSYATAWAAILSGNYLVIEVGQAALNALYFNACGWANPSAEDPGTTPFYYYANVTIDTLLGPDAFVNGNAAASAQAVALPTDLAYYALHGALPSGVTALPAAQGVSDVCLGSPTN